MLPSFFEVDPDMWRRALGPLGRGLKTPPYLGAVVAGLQARRGGV